MDALEVLPGGSAGPPATGFEVAYVAPDGTELRRALTEAWAVPFEHALPVRAFASYRRQRNLPGLWWSSTTGRHVGYESWLERDQVMLLDFDPAVVGISSQPLWLFWSAANGRPVSHAPDYFARRDVGRPWSSTAARLNAADPALRGAGCLVVLGDEVHSARTVRKSHTTSPAAFTSPACGPIARIAESQVQMVGGVPRRRVLVGAPAREARVGVYTVALGDDGALLDLWEGKCDGLVVAAFGVGHVPERLVEGLTKLASHIPVVLASRIGNGPVLSDTYGFPGSEKDLLGRGLIGAGDLSPYQARLLLHALLAQDADHSAVRATFADSTRRSHLFWRPCSCVLTN